MTAHTTTATPPTSPTSNPITDFHLMLYFHTDIAITHGTHRVPRLRSTGGVGVPRKYQRWTLADTRPIQATCSRSNGKMDDWRQPESSLIRWQVFASHQWRTHTNTLRVQPAGRQLKELKLMREQYDHVVISPIDHGPHLAYCFSPRQYFHILETTFLDPAVFWRRHTTPQHMTEYIQRSIFHTSTRTTSVSLGPRTTATATLRLCPPEEVEAISEAPTHRELFPHLVRSVGQILVHSRASDPTSCHTCTIRVANSSFHHSPFHWCPPGPPGHGGTTTATTGPGWFLHTGSTLRSAPSLICSVDNKGSPCTLMYRLR